MSTSDLCKDLKNYKISIHAQYIKFDCDPHLSLILFVINNSSARIPFMKLTMEYEHFTPINHHKG